MKKGFISVLALVAATAAFWPAAGGASNFKGIVVAKQHGALLVASPAGALRVVHARAAVGSRLALTGNGCGRRRPREPRDDSRHRRSASRDDAHPLEQPPSDRDPEPCRPAARRRRAARGDHHRACAGRRRLDRRVDPERAARGGRRERSRAGQLQLDLGAGDDQGGRRRLGHARRSGAVGDGLAARQA